MRIVSIPPPAVCKKVHSILEQADQLYGGYGMRCSYNYNLGDLEPLGSPTWRPRVAWELGSRNRTWRAYVHYTRVEMGARNVWLCHLGPKAELTFWKTRENLDCHARRVKRTQKDMEPG